MRRQYTREPSGGPSVAGSSAAWSEIEEEEDVFSVEGSFSSLSRNTSVTVRDSPEDKLFVAVGKEFKESVSTLVWALGNMDGAKKLVLVHVHRPALMIPMGMGGKFPASQLADYQLKAYRQGEKEKMDSTLDEYMHICRREKIEAEKLITETQDIAKGLVELVAQHGITKLVMGAAADKHYSKKMKTPRSKTACAVQKQAISSCRIWFVCKGYLIYTRDGTSPSPMASPSTRSTISSHSDDSEPGRSQSFSPARWFSKGNLYNNRSKSYNVILHIENAGQSEQESNRISDLPHEPNAEVSIQEVENTGGPSENVLRSSQDPDLSRLPEEAEAESNFGLNSELNGGENEHPLIISHLISENLQVSSSNAVHECEEDVDLSSAQEQHDDSGTYDLFEELQKALTESKRWKDEAYEESCKRHKAEMEMLKANHRAKSSEMKYATEKKLREEIGGALEREKLKLDEASRQRDKAVEELQMAHEKKLALESQVLNLRRASRNLEEQLRSAKNLLNSLQNQRDELQQERDNAVKEAELLRQEKQEASIQMSSNFPEFSLSELQRATRSFDISQKVGEGGYGIVYKGFLRHTTVAIKMLQSNSLQGPSEFYQEISILSRVRHPNLVTLIGACSESCGLIYEFLPNGSLEDHLGCTGDTSPLSWQVRTRISTEICSALIFLHSNKPHSIVHGDLKPANILLDTNFVSKLSDFGISRLLNQSNSSTTILHRTDPKGTFVYMDPEFGITGELTPQSDTYSFGIILLRLLTGKPPFRIVKVVQDALEKDELQSVLDPTAGDWPFVQVKQLAHLGLRCCEMSRKCRPDLVSEVWRVLEPMKNASLGPSPLGSGEDDTRCTPSYFMCPIFQEIMREPYVAADGYTYEAEGIKGWLDSGHDTSPMTNLKLSDKQLIPNHALRSAIQEWLQRQHHQ